MKKFLKKILESLPYFAAAIALATGIWAYYEIKFARRGQNVYVPMMQASERWPGVEGRITGHSIYEKKTGRFSHSPSTHYFAEPEYVYEVDGVEFRNIRICFLHSNCATGTQREDAQALLDAYPVESAVMVYYDPDDPRTSVLRPGDEKSIARARQEISRHWRNSVILIIVTLAGGFVAVRWGKEFKEKN